MVTKLNAEFAETEESAERISLVRGQIAVLPATLRRNASRCSLLSRTRGKMSAGNTSACFHPEHFPERPASKGWPQAAGELQAGARPRRRKGMPSAASAFSLRSLR
jgi:hypothetical protein